MSQSEGADMKVTEEMLTAFNDADFSGCGNADWEDSHIRRGLQAVLDLIEVQEQQAAPIDRVRRIVWTATMDRLMTKRGVPGEPERYAGEMSAIIAEVRAIVGQP